MSQSFSNRIASGLDSRSFIKWSDVAPFDWNKADLVQRSMFKTAYKQDPASAVTKFAYVDQQNRMEAVPEQMADEEWYGNTEAPVSTKSVRFVATPSPASTTSVNPKKRSAGQMSFSALLRDSAQRLDAIASAPPAKRPSFSMSARDTDRTLRKSVSFKGPVINEEIDIILEAPPPRSNSLQEAIEQESQSLRELQQRLHAFEAEPIVMPVSMISTASFSSSGRTLPPSMTSVGAPVERRESIVIDLTMPERSSSPSSRPSSPSSRPSISIRSSAVPRISSSATMARQSYAPPRTIDLTASSQSTPSSASSYRSNNSAGTQVLTELEPLGSYGHRSSSSSSRSSSLLSMSGASLPPILLPM